MAIWMVINHELIMKIGDKMSNKKLRQPLSLSITAEESELLSKLNAHKISNVAVFRRGLKEYEADMVNNLTQNNNS